MYPWVSPQAERVPAFPWVLTRRPPASACFHTAGGAWKVLETTAASAAEGGRAAVGARGQASGQVGLQPRAARTGRAALQSPPPAHLKRVLWDPQGSPAQRRGPWQAGSVVRGGNPNPGAGCADVKPPRPGPWAQDVVGGPRRPGLAEALSPVCAEARERGQGSGVGGQDPSGSGYGRV